jgi:hypothetical protein
MNADRHGVSEELRVHRVGPLAAPAGRDLSSFAFCQPTISASYPAAKRSSRLSGSSARSELVCVTSAVVAAVVG